jgi:hypothetical protein
VEKQLTAMVTNDVLKILDGVMKDMDKLQKLIDAVDVLADDAKFISFAHKTYLPIARNYIKHKGIDHYTLNNARIRRAQLGGASRWLYYHQKRTFVKLVKMIFPVPIPSQIIDRIWQQVQSYEIRLLHQARAQHASV